MVEVKAPNKYDPADKGAATVFLAGSIEMGSAEQWQKIAVSLLPDSWTILNPRRDDWDSSWVQDPPSPQFRQQVEWELRGIENSDYVLMYLDPNTKSPISLLEFGLCLSYDAGPDLVVCVPRWIVTGKRWVLNP